MEDLFAGEPPLELVKIQGIPLPEEEDAFFEERGAGEDPLLNEKSRLQPEDLQDAVQDSTQTDSLKVVPEKIQPLIQDSIPSDSIKKLPAPQRREVRDSISQDSIKPASERPDRF